MFLFTYHISQVKGRQDEPHPSSHTLVATLMKAKTGSPISKLILLKLADNADVHGRCFPSYQYLPCIVKSRYAP